MKFNVTVEGGHTAEINLTIDEEHNTFVGSVVSADYGQGVISEGVKNGGSFNGKVELDGYKADFAASITDTGITGTLKYGWFFNKSFTGAVISA